MVILLLTALFLVSCSSLERAEFISLEDRMSSSSDNEQSSSSSNGGSSSSNEGQGSSSSVEIKSIAIGTQIWMAENLSINLPGSKCYEEKDDNCETYGRLYNWETAQTACPEDWRLPSEADLQILIENIGENINSFSALLCGHGEFDDNKYEYFNLGIYSNWWSATETNVANAYYLFMDNENAEIKGGIIKTHLFSIRCIKED
ncbi:MAG: hypothetical protein LBC85_06925 [Fibromonadaceae bacterium]|jgi:hypothetical protein|nr:hypothetical protein [Fibromonadaceae bacterium]